MVGPLGSLIMNLVRVNKSGVGRFQGVKQENTCHQAFQMVAIEDAKFIIGD